MNAWPESDASEVRVQGFAGWKAGMTHVLSRDLNPRSTTAGQEVRVPVTVVEVPKMCILGVRGYTMTPTASKPPVRPGRPRTSRRPSRSVQPYLHPKGARHRHPLLNLEEADLCEVRLIVATQPANVSEPSKVPEVMEIGSPAAAPPTACLCQGAHGRGIQLRRLLRRGHPHRCVVVIMATVGKVIRRFGGKLQSHKNSKKRRQHGNMGDFGTGYVRKTIRQAVKLVPPAHEYNKRILRISNPDEQSRQPADSSTTETSARTTSWSRAACSASRSAYPSTPAVLKTCRSTTTKSPT